jgi:CRISPR-associated endonuclease/helicase Cas3
LLHDLQDLRAFDSRNIMDCFEKGIPGEVNFDFKTAAERFKLIDERTLSVVIPYNEAARSLLKEVRFTSFPASYSRQLQLYTVNIYPQEYEALENRGLIDPNYAPFAVLGDMNFYNAETGLLIPESSGGEAIFFDG